MVRAFLTLSCNPSLHFCCLVQLNLRVDLEWKVTYVGSSESKKHDQTLASILVGPVQVGVNKFILEVFHCMLSK